MPNTLSSGSVLGSGATLTNGIYTLTMGTNGNLEVTTSTGTVVWQTATPNHNGAIATMETNGDFAITSRGRQVWDTVTENNDGAYLVLESTGNVVVLSADGLTVLFNSADTGDVTRLKPVSAEKPVRATAPR
jgi:hypothetical protein